MTRRSKKLDQRNKWTALYAEAEVEGFDDSKSMDDLKAELRAALEDDSDDDGEDGETLMIQRTDQTNKKQIALP